METKEDRRARQLKQHRQLIKEMKEDVNQMFHRKVQHDSYYQPANFKEEVNYV